MKVQSVLETCLYAGDLAAAEQFYGKVLGLDFVSRLEGRHVFFRCGTGMLLIFDPERTAAVDIGVPLHGARGPGHTAFRVPETELPSWRQWLERHHVAIETEIAWPEGGRSLYIRDPAGNSIELASPTLWGISE